MRGDTKRSFGPMAAFIVMAIAVVGYFVGLQAPMNVTRPQRVEKPTALRNNPSGHVDADRRLNAEAGVIPATTYRDMVLVTASRKPRASLIDLKPDGDGLLVEFEIEPGEKKDALEARARNRAFNGAPPTIPHPIEQRSSTSCVACHGQGVKTASLRIPRMSHQFLANCLQCHVESAPQYAAASSFRQNTFVGLPAPQAGPRAYPAAPPQIPHTTWMRSDCMSCHGYAGLHGIRTTHPWRQNCQQCHAPSSELEQTLLVSQPQFLPGPRLKTDE